MIPHYCYWSVVDCDYSYMMVAVISSGSKGWGFKDFHVWSDRAVPGAIFHHAGQFEKWGCLFKLTFLRDAVRHLNYDYFIWLDTDMWFVRNPGDPLRLLRGAPCISHLRATLHPLENSRTDWWDCPNQRFVELMRARRPSQHVFNVNGGLFIVHRDAMTVFRLAYDFGHFASRKVSLLTTNRCLPAMHMLCGNPYVHTSARASDFMVLQIGLVHFAIGCPTESHGGLLTTLEGIVNS